MSDIARLIREKNYINAESSIEHRLMEKLNHMLESKKVEIAEEIGEEISEGPVKDFVKKDIERTGKDIKKAGEKYLGHRPDTKAEKEAKAKERLAKAEYKKEKLDSKQKKIRSKLTKQREKAQDKRRKLAAKKTSVDRKTTQQNAADKE